MRVKKLSRGLIIIGFSLFTTDIFVTQEWAAESPKPVAVLELPPTPENPRNSEGDFIRLKDGRILLIYTHFTGGGGDNSSAHLSSRVSTDEGRTWSTEDQLVLENEGGENVMSVSLLRLRDGRIAMLYLRKDSWDDCRPRIRFSEDETKTWSEPVGVIPDSQIGYYVVNNDRMVQLKSGRLIIPTARHNDPSMEKFSGQGVLLCFFSDDGGRSWKKSASEWDGTPDPQSDVVSGRTTLQEPGLVQRQDGSLLMFARTNGGSQFFSESTDEGDHWTRPHPSPLVSPVSPATIERLPGSDQLVAVWNDHANIDSALTGKRTPLSAAISPDDGATWEKSRTLYDSPTGWYCYTALEPTADGHLLLAHCAGDRSKESGLARLRVTRVPVAWLTEEP